MAAAPDTSIDIEATSFGEFGSNDELETRADSECDPVDLALSVSVPATVAAAGNAAIEQVLVLTSHEPLSISPALPGQPSKVSRQCTVTTAED